MAQVQNLLDLFQKGRMDAQGPAGDANPAARPKGGPQARSAGKSGQDSLLPMAPAPAGQSDRAAASRSPFQAKVEKSKAKLAAKERGPDLRDASARHASPRGERDERATAAANPSHPEASRPRSAGKAPAERPAAPQGRPGRVERPAADSRDANAMIEESPDAAPIEPDAAGQAPALDAKARDAIKQGLEDLGIQVDDRQLEDPAFLMDILRLLQAMPIQALPGGEARPETQPAQAVPSDAEAASAAPIDAALPEIPAGDQAADAAAPSEAAQAGNPGERPAHVTRKELARLLEGRIAGLERAAQDRGGRTQAGTQPHTAAPAGQWQAAAGRGHSESPVHEALPLADLDRLRVMQASAMQAASPAGAESAGTRSDLVLETDSIDPASETASAGPAEAGRDAGAASERDAQTDLFGKNGDQAAGAEAARKDGPQAPKEGSAGPQFHAALDHARASEHRSGAATAAEARPAMHDAPALEQIARKLAAAAPKHGDEISIQLSPEHLGKVRVSLEMKEGAMNARIAVENDAVRKQVESNLASLKDALKEQGIQLQGMEVSVDQRHASLFNPDGSNAESFFRRRGGHGGDGGHAGPEAAPFESAPEAETGRRWGYNTMEYIG